MYQVYSVLTDGFDGEVISRTCIGLFFDEAEAKQIADKPSIRKLRKPVVPSLTRKSGKFIAHLRP